MVVGQAHISAPAGSADVLTRGQIYRVYYVQRSDQFLSIECRVAHSFVIHRTRLLGVGQRWSA